MVHVPIKRIGQRYEEANGCSLCSKPKYLLEINSSFLNKPSRYKFSLSLYYVLVGISLPLVHPFSVHYIPPFRSHSHKRECPCCQKSLELKRHCLLPNICICRGAGFGEYCTGPRDISLYFFSVACSAIRAFIIWSSVMRPSVDSNIRLLIAGSRPKFMLASCPPFSLHRHEVQPSETRADASRYGIAPERVRFRNTDRLADYSNQ